jgi:UPF0271 protein
MRTLDLNCDLGEGAGHDAELMPLITSANVACGGHAGDDATMADTVELAIHHGVAIGAHPGFADRENFGRSELPIAPAQAQALIVEQVFALKTVVEARGGRLHHMKLHGALYNMAARDHELAEAASEAIARVDRTLILYAPWGSQMAQVAARARLRVAHEVFADRTYQRDGSLTPRSRPDALISDEGAAVAQVLRMAKEGRVRATDGTDVAIAADTVCVHGDGPHPVAFAARLRTDLAREGITVRTFGK